jgi:3',5'-cyclic-AMP phosphodiesterase
MKIYIVSDAHVVPAGETTKGLDTGERLGIALRDLAENHADADLCVLLGDLTDHGNEAAYRTFAAKLAGVKTPLVYLLGNHDERVSFRHVFPSVPVDENGFVQTVRDTPAGRLIFLDTNEQGYVNGHLCARRMAWLEARLDEAKGRPAYVFLHHPPFDTGSRVDAIKLVQTDAFAAALKRHGDVRHILAGHTHRTCSGQWRGFSFTNLGAINYNLGVAKGKGDQWGQPFGGPIYAGVMLIGADQVVVHVHDVNPYNPPLPAVLFPIGSIETIIANHGKLPTA